MVFHAVVDKDTHKIRQEKRMFQESLVIAFFFTTFTRMNGCRFYSSQNRCLHEPIHHV